jgi:hypothetical protein
MTFTTINERLATSLDQKGITITQLHATTGIPYNTLQQTLAGKIKAMGIDKFAAIWQAYPSLDAWHILTGTPSVDPCAEVAEKLQQVRAIVG